MSYGIITSRNTNEIIDFYVSENIVTSIWAVAHTAVAASCAAAQENCEIKVKDMRYNWIDENLMSKTGVTKDHKLEWNWIRYHIGGKMFAAVCLNSENKPHYITLKCDPLESEFLRKEYEDIIPGYYMNKTHWISVEADGNVPDEVLRDLLDKAYTLVLKSLSKKMQAEITNSN